MPYRTPLGSAAQESQIATSTGTPNPLDISGYSSVGGNIVPLPSDTGLFAIVDPNAEEQDVRSYLVLPQGIDRTPTLTSIDDFERGLYNLSGREFDNVKKQLGIKDDSTKPTREFVDKALRFAKDLSADNFFNAQLGRTSYSFSRALFDPNYSKAKGTGDGVSRQVTLTSADAAIAEFQSLAREYIGRELSLKDAKAYASRLNKLERSRPTTVTSSDGATTTVAGGLNADEKEQLALDIIGKYIPIEGIENVGGAIGNNLRTIKSLASDYGMALSDTELRKYSIDSLTTADGLKNIETKFNNLARVKYRALVPYLDQGLSVRDIASEYMSKKAQLLELNPAQVQLTDPDIQAAFTGESLVPLYQFEMGLRKNPQWQYTNNARSEASSYALSVLQDFGIV